MTELTQREAEIMHWVAMGKTYAEVGMILGISANTVKNHMKSICGKLDASNRMQAVWKLQQRQAKELP